MTGCRRSRTSTSGAVQRRTVGVLSGERRPRRARRDRRHHRRRPARPRRRRHRLRLGPRADRRRAGRGGDRRPAGPDQRPGRPPGRAGRRATPSPSSAPWSPSWPRRCRRCRCCWSGLFALRRGHRVRAAGALRRRRPRRSPSTAAATCRWWSGRRRSARCSGPNLAGPGDDLGRSLGPAAARRRLRRVGRGVRLVVALVVLALLRPDPLLLARRRGRRGARATGAAGATGAARARGLGLAGRPARADRGGRLPLGDGRRHGHDAGAHGPRRRPRGDDAAPHRPGHQRARGRHVPLLAAGRPAGRPGRTPDDGRGRRRCSCSPPPRWPARRRRAPPSSSARVSCCSGSGWSCGLIAGSTLVTESVAADLRPTAQGGTDLLMGLGAALAGVVGGPLLAVGGLRPGLRGVGRAGRCRWPWCG